MDDNKDFELVERCRNGDRAALADLIGKYEKPIFNAAYRIAGNPEDARDITQTVFLKAYEKLEDFDSKYRFFSWIYRIAVNESLNLLRRNGRERPLGDQDLATETATPERLANEAELGARVQAALMRMKPEDRVVLTLRHFSECSYREMAVILGIEEKTVKSRLYSARQRMRQLLQEWHES